ncbi:vacuolar protein sorting-associated protein 4B-like [Mercenaria mercenaria]|uniref:vacuolar protein sorting-associated protein 4B-like n=1 Tax=Mercenaria mercenaria TaxID=6596 RepID=UPI00234E845E|nr:vacuolar protein sorting-associated protein 4B-like [Mercenaria mercenaria]
MSEQANGEINDDKDIREFLQYAEVSEAPSTKWEDVAGIETACEKMKAYVIVPVKFPHLFTGGVRSTGFLIYGPPGVGKTLLVQVTIAELSTCNVLCYKISAYDLLSRWQKHPTKALRAMFRKAEGCKFSVMFIDDFEVLSDQCGNTESGRRLKEDFVSFTRYFRSNCHESTLCIIGITNKPWKMAEDFSLRQIMDRRVYTPLPDSKARIAIFKQQLSSVQHSLLEEDFRMLGERSDGLSGADISTVVRDSSMQPIRKIQVATHFKQISGPCSEDPNKIVDDLLTPCSRDDPGAIEMDWTQIEANKLAPQVLTMDDVMKSL